MRLNIANIAAAACGALMLMLLLVQPRWVPADPHGAIADQVVADLQNVEVRAAR